MTEPTMTAASDQMKMWMRDLADMEANYRETLTRRGFSKRIANRMTEELHESLLQSVFGKPASITDLFK